jgi:hypothetical protein
MKVRFVASGKAKFIKVTDHNDPGGELKDKAIALPAELELRSYNGLTGLVDIDKSEKKDGQYVEAARNFVVQVDHDVRIADDAKPECVPSAPAKAGGAEGQPAAPK